MADRYDVDPSRLKGQKSLIEYVKDVTNRVTEGSASLQVGHTSIEDGDFVVRNGDIIVSETDGVVVMRIIHGAIPEIQMFPLGGTDTHRVVIFGADFNSGVGTPNQTIQIGVETIDGFQDGGKLLLTKTEAIFSHQPDIGNESFLWFNAPVPTLNQEAVYCGRWPNQYQFNNQMGIYTGVINAGAGFSSWTHTYLTSFATTAAPVVGLVNNPVVTWTILSFTTSAFTVGWSGTAAKTITFWNFRIT